MRRLTWSILVLSAFGTQALISLILCFWLIYLNWKGKLDVEHAKGTKKYEIEMKKQQTLGDILLMGNDAQVLTGVLHIDHVRRRLCR
jgi:hypothetical protein